MTETEEADRIELPVGEIPDQISVSLVNTERTDTFLFQGDKAIIIQTTDLPKLIAILQKTWTKYCSISAHKKQ